MQEAKDRIHGRLRAREVLSHIRLLIPLRQRECYTERFLAQLEKYSFRGHREDEERHEGCKYWLEGIVNIDFKIPEQYALLVMGDMDRKQQKQNARRFYNAFIEEFSRR
jgi:hypothetical protein